MTNYSTSNMFYLDIIFHYCAKIVTLVSAEVFSKLCSSLLTIGVSGIIRIVRRESVYNGEHFAEKTCIEIR